MTSHQTQNQHAKPQLAAWAVAIAGSVALLCLPWALADIGNSWVRVACVALLYAMLAVSLNISVGYAGLLDLGFVAFYALGAYTYALLASPHLWEQFPAMSAVLAQGTLASTIFLPILGGLVAGLFALLIGIPTLRLRGDYLAIVALGFGETTRLFLNNLNAPLNITNGPQGINMIAPLQIGPWALDRTLHLGQFEIPVLILTYYFFLVLTALLMVVCSNLIQSRQGRAWVALRDDPQAAQAAGISLAHTRLSAYGLAAVFGGISGGLFASFQGFVSPESFSLMETVIILCMVVLGGLGHARGVLLGALLLAVFPEILREVVAPLQIALFGKIALETEILRSLVYGLTMILIMVFRPQGLYPTKTGQLLRPAQGGKHA